MFNLNFVSFAHSCETNVFFYANVQDEETKGMGCGNVAD